MPGLYPVRASFSPDTLLFGDSGIIAKSNSFVLNKETNRLIGWRWFRRSLLSAQSCCCINIEIMIWKYCPNWRFFLFIFEEDFSGVVEKISFCRLLNLVVLVVVQNLFPPKSIIVVDLMERSNDKELSSKRSRTNVLLIE